MRFHLIENLIYPLVADAQLKQLVRFYQELAALIKSGIPVRQTLRHMAGQESYRRLVPILRECLLEIEAGGRLSDAFARFPAVFPAVHTAILRAGEQGGQLEAALHQIVELLERELRVRRFLGAETIYAKTVFVCCLFVVPALMGFLMGVSAVDVLRNLLATLVPLLVAALMLGLLFAAVRTALLRSDSFAAAYDRIKWKLPLLGTVTRKMAWAAFGRTFGALYGAGVLPGEAIPFALRASGSNILSSHSDAFARDLRNGIALSVPLRESGCFPAPLVEYVVTGEDSGNIDAMMRHVADQLSAEGEAQAFLNSWLFGQLFFLFVALFVTSGILSSAIRVLFTPHG